MKTELYNILDVNPNPNNPRKISDSQRAQLEKSIRDFPEMLHLRPIVIDETNTILGGNMRYQVMLDMGHTSIPVIKADDLTPEQKREFIIKDNLGYGDWDWDMLQVDWDMELLGDWGLTYLEQETQLDYSILDDDDDVDSTLGDMEKNVMRGIQIELYPEHYDECQELIKFWREQEAYIGGLLLEKLKEEKDKL